MTSFSPFAFFRRHQATLMVITLLLVMFVFTIGDSLFQISSGRIPKTLVFLTFIIVGALFGWTYGMRRGKALNHSLVGGAVGLLIAFLGTSFLSGIEKSRNARVTTTLGEFTQDELRSWMEDQQTANQFIRNIRDAARPNALENPERQFEAYYWDYLTQQMGFNFGPDLQQSATMSYLLQKEADEIGLRISNQMVQDEINNMTAENLGRLEYQQVLKSMKMTEAQMFEIMKKQMKAQYVLNLRSPNVVQTPGDYWEVYRKTSVTQDMGTTAIPVSEFLKSVPEPTESELLTFFEKHKDTYPSLEGDPGFRQPRKIQIAYLEADYNQIEGTIEKVTSEEIQEYYEKHPDEFRVEVFPETNTSNTTPNSTGNQNGPIDFSQPVIPIEAMKPEEESTPAPEPVNEADNEATEKSKSDATLKSDKNSDIKSEEDALKIPQQTPPEEKKSAEKASRNFLRKTIPVSTVLLQETSDDNTKSPADSTDEKSDNTDTTNSQGKTAPKENSETNTASDNKDSANTASQSSDTSPATPTPTANGNSNSKEPEKEPNSTNPPELRLPVSSGNEESNSQESTTTSGDLPAPEPQYELRPLDDDLKFEIEENLLRTRTQAKLNSLIAKASDEVSELSVDYLIADDDPAKLAEIRASVLEALKKYAASNELSFHQTPAMTEEQYATSEDYPIGQASEYIENAPPTSRGDTVGQILFRSPPSQMLIPYKGKDNVQGENLFVFFKIADVKSHVPPFEEEGVRDQVHKAWKEGKARELAQKRAEEIATQIRESEENMSQVLGVQTVTEEEGSPQLTYRQTGNFSWLSLPPPDATQPMAERNLQITSLISLDKIGSQFMKTVFDEMKPGEVGVVPNQNKSTYYVVKILSRAPTTEEAKKQMFERYAKTPFRGQSMFSRILGSQQTMISQHYLGSLYEKYGLRVLNPEEK